MIDNIISKLCLKSNINFFAEGVYTSSTSKTQEISKSAL